MSASEKLKAMEQEGVRFMVPPDLYRNALPEIIAVVEAAEPFAVVSGSPIATNVKEGYALIAALAALDEKLS